MQRTIVIRKSDKVVVNGYEVTGEMLKLLMDPAARLLWAFVEKDGRLQVVPYDENKVIWMDLENVDAS